MAGITISNLVKTYPGGTTRATDDVSLEVADGEFLVLVGPSGCGKTTLLRMIAGLERPDAGSISMDGTDITWLPPRARNLSMVFQSYAIFPHMRVRQNIAFGLAMRKVSRAERDRRVEWAADLLALGDLLDRFPAQLSGGQRQRVAVARALVVDAGVLLMDEPLSNLDAKLRLSFRTELKRIVAQVGTTTVYVTHDQAEAMSLGDRTAVMRDGRIVQIGPPLDVYDRPVDEFVGGFLGAPPMNFLPVTVDRSGDRPALRLGDQVLPAPEQATGRHGDRLTLGVRAESITVAGTATGNGTGADGTDGVLATVQVVEPTGATLLLTVAVDGHQIKVQAPPTFRTGAGATVRLTFDPDRLRCYQPTDHAGE